MAVQIIQNANLSKKLNRKIGDYLNIVPIFVYEITRNGILQKSYNYPEILHQSAMRKNIE